MKHESIELRDKRSFKEWAALVTAESIPAWADRTYRTNTVIDVMASVVEDAELSKGMKLLQGE